MKNKNLKININRPELSKEEINGMQDFGSVINGLNKIPKPFYKTNLFYAGSIVCAIVIVTGILWLNQSNKVELSDTKQVAAINTAFIKPAIPGIQIAFTSYEVESGIADTILTATGSKILIPASPFLNNLGEPIKGKVEIKYREFRDPVDFALSGIPMSYDSAGKQYQFESAGMCEITGSQNNKAVFVNPNSPVTIEMKAVRSDPKYNLYYLDTVEKNWIFKGKPILSHPTNEIPDKEMIKPKATDSKSIIENQTKAKDETEILNEDRTEMATIPKNSITRNTSQIEYKNEKFMNKILEFQKAHSKLTQEEKNEHRKKQLAKEMEILKKQKPIEPKKANNSLPHFKLNFKSKDFPELDSYKGAVFEVTEADRTRSVALFAINWDNITYETIESGKKYNVKMELYDKKNRILGQPFKIIRTENMIVHPVFEEQDYENALAIFNKKDQEYKEKMAEKLENEKQRIAIQKEKEENELQRVKSYQVKRDKVVQNNTVFYNTISIAQFGIYNCDHPFTGYNSNGITLTFIDDEDKVKYVETIYHLDFTINSARPFHYYNCCNNPFTFNTQNKQLLFTVFADGKIGYYSPDNCRTLKPTINNRVKMEISDKTFNSVEEVKHFLGIGNN